MFLIKEDQVKIQNIFQWQSYKNSQILYKDLIRLKI